jgi:hypothetical protein
LEFPKDQQWGMATVYFSAVGDVYGMEKVSATQTGTTDALRFFTSNFVNSPPHLAFGKYTNATAFTEYARFINSGNLGIGTNAPTSTMQVNGSIANNITVISADLALDQSHKTVIIPLSSEFTVTLPAAPGVTGRIYSIVNNSVASKSVTTNYIKLDGSSTSTINPSSAVEVQSDGNNWYQIR